MRKPTASHLRTVAIDVHARKLGWAAGLAGCRALPGCRESIEHLKYALLTACRRIFTKTGSLLAQAPTDQARRKQRVVAALAASLWAAERSPSSRATVTSGGTAAADRDAAAVAADGTSTVTDGGAANGQTTVADNRTNGATEDDGKSDSDPETYTLKLNDGSRLHIRHIAVAYPPRPSLGNGNGNGNGHSSSGNGVGSGSDHFSAHPGNGNSGSNGHAQAAEFGGLLIALHGSARCPAAKLQRRAAAVAQYCEAQFAKLG